VILSNSMSTKLNLNNTSWNLKLLFDNLDQPIDKLLEEEREELQTEAKKFVQKWENKTDYLKNPSILKEALNDYENWRRNWGSSGRQGFYLALSLALDQNNSELKAKESKINEISVDIENQIQFFTHRLSRVDSAKQQEFLSSVELKEYRHFLEILFNSSKHLLSEAEEKILNLKHFTSHTKWVQMLEGFLSKEERKIVMEDGTSQIQNFSQIINLTSHKNKSIRDQAAAAFNDILAKYVEVAENEINAVLYNKKVNDTLRKFHRPDQSRHLTDDVDTDMVDQLVESVANRFEVARKFYELKAKLFGVSKLAYHERNVEYGDLDMNFDWSKAATLVYDTFMSLDQTFADIFEMFLNQGLIDVFPKKGKDSGAFCASVRSNLPIYVMLNHTGRLNDVRTLAHEMGHAINFEMMRHENELNYDCSLFLAESCSTFMEDFVLQKIIQDASEEQKLAIMMEKLNNDISTIFRQIAFYRFETDLHLTFKDTGYLSHEQIGTIFTKHMIDYMGDFVSQDEGSQNWWIYVGHFRNFFYVYSYAGGLLVSKYLQSQVKKDKSFIDQVKQYYSTGLSKSPKQTLEDIGVKVDKSFWNKGLDEVEQLLNEATFLAKKLGKI